MIKFVWSKGGKTKKYKVVMFNNDKKIKTIQFGSKKYQQFKDTTPLKLYSNLDHNDNKRKKNYFSRHKINYPKYSPDWFSKKYLWS